MQEQKKRFYDFGPYRLDPVRRQLLKDGASVQLTPKAFDTLLALVEERGNLLEKDVLINRIWPDSFVEEGNLTVTISMLRKALGENRGAHRYIVTIPGKGYRFVADVREWWGDGGELIVEEHTRSRVVIQEESSQAEKTYEQVAIQTGLAFNPSRLNMSQRVLATSLALIGIAVSAYYVMVLNRAKTVEAETRHASIAVLPFKVLSPDENDDYLSYGMAETLITKLNNTKQVEVRPTSAVRKYGADGIDPVAAGRELKVDSILDGSIQKIGNKLRVTVRLLRVKDGAVLWTTPFDGEFANIFSVQDSISERVADALFLNLNDEQKRLLARRYTENTDAYQMYLQGRFFWGRREKDDLNKAIEHFNQAIELDKNYALAYAGLADSYSLLIVGGGKNSQSAAEAISKAKESAAKALEIDDTLADAHTSMGIIYLNYDWDLHGAEQEFNRALELNPRSATAHYWYAFYLSAMGRLDEALAESRAAVEIDPLSTRMNGLLARVLCYAKQPDQAIAHLRTVLDMEPNSQHLLSILAIAYMQKGMFEESIDIWRRLANMRNNRTGELVALGQNYAFAGRSGEALSILEEIKNRAAHEYVSPYYFAEMYAALQDKELAFEWLEKAYQEREDDIIYLKIDPTFEALHGDPRFTRLLQKLGIEP